MPQYRVPKDGVEALRELFNNQQRQIDALRSAAGILSAVVGSGGVTVKDGGGIWLLNADGSRMRLVDSQIRLWDNYDENPDNYGRISVDRASGANYMRMFPPFSSGTGAENSFTVQGRRAGQPGNMWFYTDGSMQFGSGTEVRMESATQVYVKAPSVYLDATTTLDLAAPKMRLYGLASTGDDPNLAISIINGEPILRLSTSSERYKTDTAPVAVDIEDMRAYTGISWVHNTTLDESPPGDIRRNIGHHAEGMDARPSLRQFVNYDDEGRPDSVEGTSFSVAVHEYAKDIDSRQLDTDRRVLKIESENAELRDENTELRKQMAALAKRLDALETN